MVEKLKEILDLGFFISINPNGRGYWIKLEKPTPDGVKEFKTPDSPFLHMVVDWAYQLAIANK